MQPGSIRHLFRLKRACKTEAYWKIRICVSAGLSICFAVLFLFLRSFSGSLLFWKAPERVQKMKKVNRNNGVIDVTTVGFIMSNKYILGLYKYCREARRDFAVCSAKVPDRGNEVVDRLMHMENALTYKID